MRVLWVVFVGLFLAEAANSGTELTHGGLR